MCVEMERGPTTHLFVCEVERCRGTTHVYQVVCIYGKARFILPLTGENERTKT